MTPSRLLQAVRRGLVYLLLAIAPFGGVRVVCVDEPTRPAHVVLRAAAGDCGDSCALRAAPGSRTGCALSDGDPLMGLAAFDALPASDVPTFVSWRVSHVYPDIPTRYDEPALARFIPPPEA